LKPALQPEEERKFKQSATEMGTLIQTLTSSL